jgi:hypothetical protein
MGDRTDGQRMDDETDDGTHGFKGGFISHPDVLYYIGYTQTAGSLKNVQRY